MDGNASLAPRTGFLRIVSCGTREFCERATRFRRRSRKIISASRSASEKIRTATRDFPDWPEISPKTVRDKIYLVLKKNDEPLHFETIARRINEVKFDDGQKALGPTVHNELIKDDRFVLVGRGMYGLQERGYEPGIAREVIAKVLKEKGPLTRKMS